MQDSVSPPELTGLEIAIVGMAGRFPGAPDVNAFWRNIRDGVESVTVFSDEELRARGVPERTLADPDYVKAGVLFEGFDQFDAGFFGYSPREAEHLDPQQRIFLECAWEALEHAGWQAGRGGASVGVYAGDGPNLYLMRHLLPAFGVDAGTGIADMLGLMSGNSAGSLCTRVAYKLDLRGPAVSVQTECSTSLVAVHMACQALLSHDCDMALAGGVWLNLLQEGGYRFQNGAILSPDGHCRAFDAKAAGTVIGSGAGIVVLKRLAEALRDGDTIHAVIKGTAANNDGSDKIGFTAPSVQGQASAIRAAQMVADVPAASIGYVEAHGTGTTLGDPIEMAALMQAFASGGATTPQSCAIGSVKTNIGHLDAAAGVAGLIKAALALRHATLPPSLHFEQPNPQIDFASGPFYVNTEARPWPQGAAPRRAGVSSFGIGGTNVHVVLEEAPAIAAHVPTRREPDWQVLSLSALSATAARQAAQRLGAHLESHPELALADVAHTLQTGRRAFAHRCAVVADGPAAAARMLATGEGLVVASAPVPEQAPEVVFLFPGGGTQHANMGLALYRDDDAFRADVDRCCELLRPELGFDLRELLFPAPGAETEADARLFDIAMAQPALFVVEYALAQWWMRRGVRPAAMMGHSLGEYVAACLAGVFRLEDALRVAALRGRLLQSMQPGAMTAVPLSQAELAPFLQDGCDLAAANGEQLCVLSGPIEAVEAAEQRLRAQGHLPRRLHVSIASHSAMTQPLLAELERLVASVPRQAPKIPFVSNVTGRLITAEQATSPNYWAQHLRGTVQFEAGLRTLFERPGRVVLEVGPGETLAGLARQHPMAASAAGVYASQAHPQQQARNAQQLAQTLAGLWLAGVAIDWAACHAGQAPRRVPLPAYPFQRRRYWVEASASAPSARAAAADAFYVPVWKRGEPLAPTAAAGTGCVLLYGDERSLTGHLARHLRAQGHAVALAQRGLSFARTGREGWTLRPGERDDHARLLREVEAELGTVGAIHHLWCLDEVPAAQPQSELLERGFFSLLALVQALDGAGTVATTLPIAIVANQIEDITGAEALCPEKATLLGIAKVIGQECPRIHCRVIDVMLAAPESEAETLLVEQIAAEAAALRAEPGEPLSAYRGAHRWVKAYEPAPLPAAAQPRLRREGVYLITGGLGGVGLAIAKHLAQHWQARLVLLGRTAMPARDAWAALAADAGQPEAQRNRLRQLLALEALGAQVLTLSADVSDLAQLQAALAQAHVRFGALHGIVHAAGDAGGGLMAQRTRAQVDTVFSTKVRGTRALLDALRGQPLDFVQFCSSISSVAGGLGMSDYAAANAYLDAMAIAQARVGGWPVFSVNWDAWRGLGMAEHMVVPEGIGMDGPEGARTFERIVNGPLRPQTVISTTDLAQRLGPLDAGMLELLDDSGAPPAAIGGSHPRPALSTPFVAPEGELANALAALWTERLGIAPIGMDDNLFELGGDSLVAIQLLSRIRKAYTVELHPSEFFKAPTLAGLIAKLPARDTAVPPQPAAAMEIAPVPRGGALPLSPMQRRLWLVDRLTDAGNLTGRAAYNMSAGLALHGALDVERLRAAIDAIAARHEVLRTVFAEDEEGEPAALIRAGQRLDIPLVEIAEADPAVRARRYAALFDALVRQPFVLAEGPLLKATVVRLGEREHVLVLVVHHIVFDGWSIAVFARELGEFYQRALRGQPLALAPLPVQYVDYAAWYGRALASPAFAPKAEFWRAYLRDAPQVSGLKPDHERPATASHAGNSVLLELSPALSQALGVLARESDASLFTLLLASFFLFFHQASGADDLVIGTDVAGRGHPDLEQLLGFFVNVVPLRSRRADPKTDFRQWLARTKQQALAAMDHQDVPFDQIVELAGARRARDRNPLVQVLFVLQNTPEIRFAIEGAEVEVLPQQMNESKFDLAVFAREQAGALAVEWVYATDLYRRETVEQFTASWHALLERIVATPGQAIDALAPKQMQERFTMNTAKPLGTTVTTGTAGKMDKLGKLDRLGRGAAGREAPRAAARPVVQTSFLRPGAEFPIVLQATTGDLDTVAWARSQADYIEMLVARHGGVLFRDFGLKTPQDFEAFAEAIEPELYGSYGDLPKKEGGKKTYRSTPYPERQMILYHNESSHLDRWPRKQWFFCELPSPVGGATPIVDCREMLRRLPAEMVAEFERKELLYVRTFTPGLDVSWRDFYKTDRREEVEARLAAAGIAWRWLDEDTLQTRTRCPAVIRHPITGEKVFFNQIQLHHVACLEPQVREDLLAMGGIDRLPRHVMYGDGSPIADQTMAVVGRVYEECAVRFDWRQGDIVMLDNMLAAHARDPYEGPRKIVVAMGAMFDRAALEGAPPATADTRLADEQGA
ncbi:SDR family NAD(P)-dependent oxidoreductase [Variovorax sp.]|jgi:acyl transferase domain-containing protein/alpha-ketoglutarate-dependent taurine dioxygenase/acyl carrier protein|uniref:SDR family NAD(P)-dependent oxidoreductase n=2 Tax=Variovorax sp. TaxID=1871043 RepID=UPI0011FFA0EC|nr:MAG: SDR family NAD(P)-dependent oxidoreductase [Variovorax sp.]